MSHWSAHDNPLSMPFLPSIHLSSFCVNLLHDATTSQGDNQLEENYELDHWFLLLYLGSLDYDKEGCLNGQFGFKKLSYILFTKRRRMNHILFL